MPIKITIRKNGPYFIAPEEVSQVNLVDHEGNPVAIPGKSITLCRCGGSSKKPFCDGTHSKIGFQGAEQAVQAHDQQQQQGQGQQQQQQQRPGEGEQPK